MRSNLRRLSIAFATTLLVLPLTMARAQVTSFSAYLSGLNESPPNNSPGIGMTIVTLDETLATLRVQVAFFGLLAPNTAAHIHCCTASPLLGTAGVATVTPTFTDFPPGTSGWYDHTFDMALSSSYNPAFITANGGTVKSAFTALTAGMFAEKTYLNIHTSVNPGGEIRGFLQQTPEPGTYALMATGLLALGAAAHWRRRA